MNSHRLDLTERMFPTGPAWLTIATTTLLLVAIILSLGRAMRMNDHNEEMYIAAGIRVAEGRVPYRDFSYVQMPYLPGIHGALFRLCGMRRPLLVARTFNWLAWITGAGLLYLACRRAGNPRQACLAISLLYVANPFMLLITHEASTYAPPATLGIGQAVACLWLGTQNRTRSQLALASLVGVLGGLAVGIKLYFLAVTVPYVILAAFAADRRFNHTHAACAVAGFCVALVPAAILCACVPREFFFNNLLIHSLNTAAYRVLDQRSGGLVPNMTLLAKTRFITWGMLSSPCILATLAVTGWAWWNSRIRSLRYRDCNPHAVAAATAALLGVAVACFMTPCFPQYLALMMPYLLLFAAMTIGDTLPRHSGTRSFLCTVAAVVGFAAFASLEDARAVINPALAWHPIRTARAGKAVRSQIESLDAIGKLATIQPLRAINAGLPFYDEFATGPFVYAIVDGLSDDDQKRYVVVGSRRIAEVLDADPPAAILAGLYPPGWFFNDDALRDYAERHGYTRTGIPQIPNADLYVRPKAR